MSITLMIYTVQNAVLLNACILVFLSMNVTLCVRARVHACINSVNAPDVLYIIVDLPSLPFLCREQPDP